MVGSQTLHSSSAEAMGLWNGVRCSFASWPSKGAVGQVFKWVSMNLGILHVWMGEIPLRFPRPQFQLSPECAPALKKEALFWAPGCNALGVHTARFRSFFLKYYFCETFAPECNSAFILSWYSSYLSDIDFFTFPWDTMEWGILQRKIVCWSKEI